MLSKEKKLENDTFCDKFFVVSFSKNCKIIEDSIKYKADCNHKFCKQAYAIEPEIIYKYEKRKDGLEINNITASILFPNGIKLCYGEEDGKIIKTVRNFSTIFTNQTGGYPFAYIYHFYIKKKYEEFESKYEMNPIRHELTEYLNKPKKRVK